MDGNLITQLTLFAHSVTQAVLVRRYELPSTAAFLACNGVMDYHVEPVTLDDEEWYQLTPATEPLWAASPPMQYTYAYTMI
ncbi:hypothetical protein [Alicyclobacillus ferrooxydans]|uniref:Uncharacterized protein n=1 Tax=Alicyclobacillus ferrooxydans TaxID=471514 RepID=A0A0P9GW34_9BACL|nr:hypothetical protein [Alicyclobacillus ferrooxydans]KPV45498.1 hypothetical protein AN477_00610 [Alicyclobacillus ferrooxydans]